MALSIIENGKKLESTIDFSNFLKEFKKISSARATRCFGYNIGCISVN